jgi:hypothetical protein
MFNKNRVQSWIPKKLSHLIETIDEDSEVIEVILNPQFHNASELETVWIFAKERYSFREYTLAQIKDDLRRWLDCVEHK